MKKQILGCMTVALGLVACGGSDTSEEQIANLSDLTASPLQWEQCAEKYSQDRESFIKCVTKTRDLREDAAEGDGDADSTLPVPCDSAFEACITKAYELEDSDVDTEALIEVCETELNMCEHSWPVECYEPLVACWDGMDEGGCEVFEVVNHCVPVDECQADFDACMDSCGEDNHLEMECEAQRLICEGMPEDCAYRYAECRYVDWFEGGEDPEGPPAHTGPVPMPVEPDHGIGDGAVPPHVFLDCEQILEDCECSEPSDPGVCPGGYAVGEAVPAPGDDECYSCVCSEGGHIDCEEIECNVTPEPPPVGNCDSEDIGDECFCDEDDRVFCFVPPENCDALDCDPCYHLANDPEFAEFLSIAPGCFCDGEALYCEDLPLNPPPTP